MLVSAGKDLKEPLLIALAEREDANRSGKMVVSCHIAFYYIDYECDVDKL